MLDPTDNLVQSFQLESSHLRGRLVRLGAALDIILHQHAYPAPVAQLLAEATVIATALASSLKYDGVFTLQTKSDGVVRMLVVDVISDGGVRAYAMFDRDHFRASPAVQAFDMAALLGKGYLAFTCALTGKEDRYQGIVALEGGSLAEAVQHYFRQSEQLPTGIIAAAHRDNHGRWRGGCLLLQKMPREGGIFNEIGDLHLAAASEEAAVKRSRFDIESADPLPEAEDWTRAMMVMGTCTPFELTDVALPAETLLFRLFHEEGVRVYEPTHLRHQCRCSQTRVTAMLRALPRAEVEERTDNGIVTVTCEFCNKSYVFDEKEVAALYAGTPD